MASVGIKGVKCKTSILFHDKPGSVMLMGESEDFARVEYELPVDEEVQELFKQDRNLYIFMIYLLIGAYLGSMPDRLTGNALSKLMDSTPPGLTGKEEIKEQHCDANGNPVALN